MYSSTYMYIYTFIYIYIYVNMLTQIDQMQQFPRVPWLNVCHGPHHGI